MKIIKVDVNKLKLADYNPRVQLKAGDRAYEDLKKWIRLSVLGFPNAKRSPHFYKWGRFTL
jgi:hypothetical protein